MLSLAGYYGLVGGFKHFLFSIIYGIILPIDFHIFQDGSKPPASGLSMEYQRISLEYVL